MNRPPTQRIGRYRLEGLVGTGAFGTVYRGVDERLEDTVALKVLAENHSLDPDMRERFMAEGRVLRRIDSRHVIRVHDLGETDQTQPYLVLEYADRGTLASRVADLRRRGWRPTRDDVLALARPLASAMEDIHRANVVHRDLSPGNALLCSTAEAVTPQSSRLVVAADERLVLADLGLCKDLARNSGHTAAGGTEGFRPPEQRGGPAIIGPAADLWSLSALVVWLVIGAPPRDRSVREGIVSGGLPPQLGAVLDRSLADDPAARHPSPNAWLDAVQEALVPSRAAPNVLPAPLRPARSRRLVRVGALVAAIVGAVTLAVPLTARALSSDGGTEVTRIGPDEVRVSRGDDGATVAIVGPEETTVEQSVTFAADVGEDMTGHVWVTPESTVVADAAELQVRATSPGVATVTLIGVTASGDLLSVAHDLNVAAGDSGE